MNRLFLLGSLVVSMILPITPVINNTRLNQLQHEVTGINPLSKLYNSFSILSSENQTVPAVENIDQPQKPSDVIGALTLKELLAGLYILIALILLLRFVSQLFNLFFLIEKNKKNFSNGVSFCEHDLELSPFSFFNHLIINQSLYSDEQLKQIMAHEKVHIRQWHTLDILFVEVIHIFLWINPLMVFLKQYLKLNLEYLADENVLDTGVDRKNYQLSILHTCLNPEAYPLTNLFNSSKLKLRIKMMNAKKTPLSNLYKYIVVLPLIAATYFVINPLYGQPVRELVLSKEQQHQLKAFEGKYSMQLEKGKLFFLQITAKENELLLKQLWDGKEISFALQSELEFQAKDQRFPLKFIKGKDGSIKQLLAFNRDLWDRVAAETDQKQIQLTQQQLKAFEGYFEFQNNRGTYIQFTVKQNNLVGIQMWDGKEHVLTAQSELEFITPEGLTAKFIKSKAGAITQVLVPENDLLDKVSEYRPLVRNVVQLSSQQLKAVEGYYLFQDNKELCMQITARENEIVIKQLWDEKEQTFAPTSELEFVSKGIPLLFRFIKGKDGQVTQLSARHGGLWDKGTKPAEKKLMTLSPEKLKVFAGKYSLKFEGKDVFMQITPTENGLLLKQLWDGKEINFLPTSELEFFNKREGFPLKFVKSKDGSIAQLQAYNKDVWNRVN